ncbi:MAG: succinylglutamate desuccinylase/aspartoacylase family protein [Alphaproteobacteria bacterium]|nr:succinylglutamate desuccinylase/aspartoacylase family protein [Alphaproteobacteria bacterium]
MHTGIFNPIDAQQDGKTVTHLSLPYSIDRSPYYQIKIPICHIRNGVGPRVLLTAGNHGDEYEGELTLLKLIQKLEPADIRGTVTILPAVNMPAVMAARRRSPFDDGNLNRAFPGDPKGKPTERIAYFIETDLVPRHDIMFDLHSGGTSMAHLPCALIERHDDPELHAKSEAAMRALGMAYGFIANNGPDTPTSIGAAFRAQIAHVSGEFGGGATVTPETMQLTGEAVDRFLIDQGVVDRPILVPDAAPPSETVLLGLDRQSLFTYALREAWFEPAVDLGDQVETGQLAGWLHDLKEITRPAEELHFEEGGIVLALRLHTHCQAGDCLAAVGRFL